MQDWNDPNSSYPEPAKAETPAGELSTAAADIETAEESQAQTQTPGHYASPQLRWIEEATRRAIADYWTPEEFDPDLDRQTWRDPYGLTRDERTLVQRCLAFFLAASETIVRHCESTLLPELDSPICQNFVKLQIEHELRQQAASQRMLLAWGEQPQQLRQLALELPAIASKLAWVDSFSKTLGQSSSNSETRQPLWLSNLLAHSLVLEGLFYQAGLVQLMNLGRRGKLSQCAAMLCRVRTAKQRHVQFGIELIDHSKQQNPHQWNSELQQLLQDCLHEAVALETRCIYDSMPRGVLALNAPMLEEHLMFTANRLGKQIGLPPLYPDALQPLPWFERDCSQATSVSEPAGPATQAFALSWD